MSSPSPHLLTLPREIRDLIFSYLVKDIDLDWGYMIFAFPIGGHNAVHVRYHDAPLLNVLLSCTQVYDEYSQGSCFKKPAASINVGKHSMQHLLENEPTNQARAMSVLRRTRHIDFHIDSADLSGSNVMWTTIDQLSRAVSVVAPNLETISVVTRPLNSQSSSYQFQEVGNMLDRNGTSVGASPPLLAGELLLHGQPAFWNRDSDHRNFCSGCRTDERPGNPMAGEWHFVRCDGKEHLAALR